MDGLRLGPIHSARARKSWLKSVSSLNPVTLMIIMDRVEFEPTTSATGACIFIQLEE
jgi:hypothetical protein